MRASEFILREKHYYTKGFHRSDPSRDPIKNPKRTFVEITNMLGITNKQLTGLILNYPGFPKPLEGIGKAGRSGKHNYYELKQVAQWIKNNNLQDRIRSYSQVAENFADKAVKGKSRPGRVKRAGASCKGSVTDLRARAKKYGGERGKMYRWCLNMKAGKQKKNK